MIRQLFQVNSPINVVGWILHFTEDAERAYNGRVDGIDEAAEQIKALQKRIYVARHEYRVINPRDFRHLDLDWYDRTRELLVKRGCRFVTDVEDVTLKGTANDFRTFIRMLVTVDGATSIGLFHPKPKWWFRIMFWVLRIKLGRIIDCESELSDGTYLVTSSAMEASKLEPPPGFDNEFFPPETPPEVVFEAHIARLRDYLAAHPSVQATRFKTQNNVIEMQHRMQTVKAAHRQRIGYATVSELEELGADRQTAEKIKDAMNREP